eukprot:s1959_g2.t1
MKKTDSMLTDRRIESFLKEHGFPGVNQPQRRGLALWPLWLRGQERIYPIHLAAQTGNHQLVLLLLAAGADPTITSSQGRSAMDFAQEASQKDISHLLHQVAAQKERVSASLSSIVERRDAAPVKDRNSSATGVLGTSAPSERRDAEENSDGKGLQFGNLESLLQDPVLRVDLSAIGHSVREVKLRQLDQTPGRFGNLPCLPDVGAGGMAFHFGRNPSARASSRSLGSSKSEDSELFEYRGAEVQSFLKENGFKHVNAARARGMLWWKELIYPIHLAAATGDQTLVLMLLAENADPLQRTSRGRTAMDVAQAADQEGTRRDVVFLLSQVAEQRQRKNTEDSDMVPEKPRHDSEPEKPRHDSAPPAEATGAVAPDVLTLESMVCVSKDPGLQQAASFRLAADSARHPDFNSSVTFEFPFKAPWPGVRLRTYGGSAQ